MGSLALCENEKLELQQMDEKTGNINNNKLYCKSLISRIHVHKLLKAYNVYKFLATAEVEVRNFRHIRFSPVKLKVILRLRIVKRSS